jgi:mitochondrial fission protein ELM1
MCIRDRLWIGCGRLSIPYALAAHEIDPGVFTVQIQSPRAPARRFGLVIPPTHDRLEGSNVLPIIGSPNRVTASLIARDAEVLSKALAFGGRPTALMLIGGPNRAFRMNEAAIMRIARTGRALARGGYAVLATGSRRTPPETLATMRRALARFPHFIWDGAPVAGLANPYFGLLGLADVILVTEDSVNMAAEAALTGKPVHILALPRRRGLGAASKFDRFHAALAETGASRPYRGAPEEWTYEPIDETARAAAELVRRLEAFRSARPVTAPG